MQRLCSATPRFGPGPTSNWLGWLDIVEEQVAQQDQLQKLAKNSGSRFQHVLLLGMGGSSLCPEVLRMTFGRSRTFHSARADSTDPAQVKFLEHQMIFRRRCLSSPANPAAR